MTAIIKVDGTIICNPTDIRVPSIIPENNMKKLIVRQLKYDLQCKPPLDVRYSIIKNKAAQNSDVSPKKVNRIKKITVLLNSEPIHLKKKIIIFFWYGVNSLFSGLLIVSHLFNN